MLAPSMTCDTSDAFHIVCRLGRYDKFDNASLDQKQKLAAGLLRHKLHTHDFAGQVSIPVSRVLGRISSFIEFAPHETCVACFSSFGLTVSFLRILCSRLCMTQRLLTEFYEQMCRVGCRMKGRCAFTESCGGLH